MIILRGLGGSQIIIHGYGSSDVLSIETAFDSAGYPAEFIQHLFPTVHRFESGRECRIGTQTFPQRTVKLKFEALNQTEIDLLFKVFVESKGMYSVIYYSPPHADQYTAEYVGRGNGSSSVFELPAKNTSSLIVYLNGVETAATLLPGGGANGVDRIEFATAPALGSMITADVTGNLRLRVRFSADKLTKEMFDHMVYRMSLELIEVKI